MPGGAAAASSLSRRRARRSRRRNRGAGSSNGSVISTGSSWTGLSSIRSARTPLSTVMEHGSSTNRNEHSSIEFDNCSESTTSSIVSPEEARQLRRRDTGRAQRRRRRLRRQRIQSSSRRVDRFRDACGLIVNHWLCKFVVVAILFANTALLGLETFPQLKQDNQLMTTVTIVNTAFLFLLTVEVLLHIVHHWSIMHIITDELYLLIDIIIIMFSWSIEFLILVDPIFFMWLNAFRIVRSCLLMTRLEIIREVVASIFMAMANITAIFVFLVLIMYIFSVLFTEMYGTRNVVQYNDDELERLRPFFGTIYDSCFTCIEFMTLEWADVGQLVYRVRKPLIVPVIIYLFASHFIAFNLIIAVLCDTVSEQTKGNLDEDDDEEEDEALDENGYAADASNILSGGSTGTHRQSMDEILLQEQQELRQPEPPQTIHDAKIDLEKQLNHWKKRLDLLMLRLRYHIESQLDIKKILVEQNEKLALIKKWEENIMKGRRRLLSRADDDDVNSLDVSSVLDRDDLSETLTSTTSAGGKKQFLPSSNERESNGERDREDENTERSSAMFEQIALSASEFNPHGSDVVHMSDKNKLSSIQMEEQRPSPPGRGLMQFSGDRTQSQLLLQIKEDIYLNADDEEGPPPCCDNQCFDRPRKVVRKFRMVCGKLINHQCVRNIMACIIIANAVLLGMATTTIIKTDEYRKNLVLQIQLGVLILYTLETSLQLIYRGISAWFFHNGFLVYDLFVVVLSWILGVDTFFQIFKTVSVLRLLRRYKLFRILTKLTTLRDMGYAMIDVTPSLFTISVFLFLIFYIFGVLFTLLFGFISKNGFLEEDYFGGIPQSFFTMLEMMSLEWGHIARDVKKVVYYTKMAQPLEGMDGFNITDEKVFVSEMLNETMNPEAGIKSSMSSGIPFIMFLIVTEFMAFNMIIAVISEAVSRRTTFVVQHEVLELQEKLRIVWSKKRELASMYRKVNELIKIENKLTVRTEEVVNELVEYYDEMLLKQEEFDKNKRSICVIS